MQKWLLLLSLFFLSPSWADGKQDAVGFQSLDVVAFSGCLPEEKAEKSVTNEFEEPDNLLFGWRDVAALKLRDGYVLTASTSYRNNGSPTSIRAPPVLI